MPRPVPRICLALLSRHFSLTIVIPRSASDEESAVAIDASSRPVILTEVRRQPNEAEGPQHCRGRFERLQLFLDISIACHSEERQRRGICRSKYS
jgi:hypothetical protein